MKTTTLTRRNERKIYILFADLKEYSANKHDLDLILKMETALYEIGSELFPETEHCFKVIGDGMLATDKSPIDLAQKALQIIERIKNKFENDATFNKKPQIRIALHVADAQNISERYLTYNIGDKEFTIFKDIAGEPVINTARIEPVVKPNFAFCSVSFSQMLAQAKEFVTTDIQTVSVGTHKLGKEHDTFEVELFAIFGKNQQLNTSELKQHIESKLAKREETYQDVSPLAQAYINITNSKNVIVNTTTGNIGGSFRVGDGN